MRYINKGAYPIDIPGVGEVEPGGDFECDKHNWARQYNIKRADDVDGGAGRPSYKVLCEIASISDLREAVAPWKIKGRSRKDILIRACEAFSYPIPEDLE